MRAFTDIIDYKNYNDGNGLEKLTSLSYEVTIDGDYVILRSSFQDGSFRYVIASIEEIGQIANAVQQASKVMTQRQRNKLDFGNQKLMELCYAAPRSIGFDCFVDPLSNDWMFIHQFANQSPMALRVEPEKCVENVYRAASMIRRAQN